MKCDMVWEIVRIGLHIGIIWPFCAEQMLLGLND